MSITDQFNDALSGGHEDDESPGITITAIAIKGGRHLTIARNGVGELHRDTFDLNSALSRKRFIGATMSVVYKAIPADDWPADVRAELDRKLLYLASVPPGGNAESVVGDGADDDRRAAALGKMEKGVRTDADGLLNDPKLLERILCDIEAVGVVGERRLAVTLYLIAVSTQLPKPLAAIVRGPTASGKSYTVEKIAQFVPPEVVLHATSITTNALFYFPPGELRHRMVVAGERSRVEDDDRAEATRALREMIEAGRLTKAVPVKENDKIVTKIIEQEGPVAFVETTTLATIFEEDANRCLLLATDERETQTRMILDATAATAAGLNRPDLDRLKAVHHAVHRMLPRVDVVIPFAPAISALYPTDRLDSRRHFRHLLGLVKASSLLHFRQRERDDDGRVVATIRDYEIAERLARGPIGAAASGVSEGARQYLAAIREKFRLDVFATSDAQKIGAGSRRTRYRRLMELHEAGAVEQTEAAKGKVPAKWRLTDMILEDGAGVLPSASSVLARFTGDTLASRS